MKATISRYVIGNEILRRRNCLHSNQQQRSVFFTIHDTPPVTMKVGPVKTETRREWREKERREKREGKMESESARLLVESGEGEPARRLSPVHQSTGVVSTALKKKSKSRAKYVAKAQLEESCTPGFADYIESKERQREAALLEKQSSTSTDDVSAANEQNHRRRISLKLPINVSRPTSAKSSPAPEPDAPERVSPQKTTDKAERELEYKHRHTFIGTASLDDFLDRLDMTPAHTTNKRHIARAFIYFASEEQLQARETSTVPVGWEVVTRTTQDIVFNDEDYVNKARTKLGSISLGGFLKLMHFDDQGNVDAMRVVEAFCLASHLDGEATKGVGSKAKAFRKWMLAREDGQTGVTL